MPNRTRSARTRRLVAAAAGLALVPALTGCFSGFEATTNVQVTQNSGNGTQARAGDIRVDAATLVTAPPETGGATLTMRVTNDGAEADELTAVQIGGTPAYVTGGTVPIDPGTSVSFGYESTLWINAYGLDTPPSGYVPVELTFARAGTVAMQVLTVPPVGMYEGIAPNPPQPPAATPAA